MGPLAQDEEIFFSASLDIPHPKQAKRVEGRTIALHHFI
jgi:hypothetical protein